MRAVLGAHVGHAGAVASSQPKRKAGRGAPSIGADASSASSSSSSLARGLVIRSLIHRVGRGRRGHGVAVAPSSSTTSTTSSAASTSSIGGMSLREALY